MDRLQWYWFAYNRRRFVDLAIRIVFGRKIHLAICTGAGLVYAGLAFLSGAPGGALDLLAESLFLGAATVAGLVAVGVILILLLCLRGTATFDIPWPTPDPTLGLKLWRRCANLVITDATFLFVAYGFGFPFLLFEPEVVTTSASVTVLLSVVGGLTLFAVFAVLGLMIIHHAMQVARDSKLLELEDNMLERDETFRAALLPHYQALQALETWPIDRSMFAKLASSFAIPAITQAALLSWRAVSINAAP